MELWRFLLFSSLEYVGMIVLMFAVFRFSFRGFIPHTVFICVLLSFISHYFRENGLVNFSALAQVVLFVICIYLIYRVHWFYAIIMGTFGYQAYVTLQILMFLIVKRLGLMTVEELSYANKKGVLNLLVYLGLIVVGALIARNKGWGFTFVPSGNFIRVKMTGLNVSIFLLSVVSIVIIGIAHYFYGENRLHSFFALSFLQLAFLLGLILYSMRKERQDLG